MRLARLYLRQREPEKACEILSPLVECDGAPPAAVLWYMEALFCLKKLPALRLLFERHAPIIASHPIIASQGKQPEALLGMWQPETARLLAAHHA